MAVTKKEADGEHPADHYLVVEDPQQSSTWHLRVHDTSGKLDHGLMGAAWAALHGGYRGNKYQGPQKQKAIEELKGLYADEKIPTPGGGMSELAGRWVDVWKPGEYSGEHYTVQDLDHIVQTYNPAQDEAPITLDHDNKGPAFGWVRGVRNDAGTLQAMFDQVDPGFEAEVKAGRYKKVSVELIGKDRGPILAAVSFLGAKRPMVKGLRPAFAEPPDPASLIIFERDFEFPGRINQEEELMEKEELKKTFGEVLRDWAESVGLVKKADPAAGKTFSEAEVVAREKVAADAAKAAIEKEFAEKEKAETAKADRKTQIREFIERLKPLGKWIPAFEKLGLVEFMEALPAEQTIEFGEEGKKEKKPAVEIFQKFVEGLPKIVEFGERAAPGGAGATGTVKFHEAPGVALDMHSVAVKARAEAIAAEKKITFGEALSLARGELGEKAATA